MPSNISFGVYFRKSLKLSSRICRAGSRIYKISSTVSKVNGDGVRGGGGHSNCAFYSVKLCVMINFSPFQISFFGGVSVKLCVMINFSPFQIFFFGAGRHHLGIIQARRRKQASFSEQ